MERANAGVVFERERERGDELKKLQQRGGRVFSVLKGCISGGF